jgi:hypothetical protein
VLPDTPELKNAHKEKPLLLPTIVGSQVVFSLIADNFLSWLGVEAVCTGARACKSSAIAVLNKKTAANALLNKVDFFIIDLLILELL